MKEISMIYFLRNAPDDRTRIEGHRDRTREGFTPVNHGNAEIKHFLMAIFFAILISLIGSLGLWLLLSYI